MQRFSRAVIGIGVAAVAAAACGCMHSTTTMDGTDYAAPDPVRAESALRRTVNDLLRSAPQMPADRHAEFKKKKPFYFKEYALYPCETDDYDVLLTATELRTTPFTATVNVPKVRFSTIPRRRKKDARQDDHFLRQTGRETRSYECRQNEWVYLGGFFEVEKTEENVNGEWVPLREEVAKVIQAEEEKSKGWWRRFWDWVRGKDDDAE